MKKICMCLVLGSAVTGMMIGAVSSYITSTMLKEKISLSEVMRCKAKSALSNLTK